MYDADMRQKNSDAGWYGADQGLIIRRYRSDDDAAEEMAEALQRGWEVLSHNVVWKPSSFIGIPFLFVAFPFAFFSDRTEHVVTYVKR